MPTTTVNGCDDCPFHLNGRYYCALEQKGTYGDRSTPHRGGTKVTLPHPDWCPLLREPITVTLKPD